MNPTQQKFQEFILERVQESKSEEARDLLYESFQKQKEHSFDRAYLLSFIPRMKALLKPEHIDEVETIMNQFGSKFTR
ncbi:hypothetical protein [Sporosarcina obsidiansis]|uniref:hypothetical protein n=1 Tax=Sporosarcina obsidiansis TaxID=2660748 RepID=UPI00129A46C3|nr:hypothetical protein [Sporosarcina obsidiansis]